MNRELLLLGLLRHKDMHGYELHEFINRDMAFCTDIKKPTAYNILQKMAESGWVTEIEEQDGNRPPRKVYQITSEGEQVFQKLLRENLQQHHQARFTDDIGLAFIDAIPSEEAILLLKKRRAILQHEFDVLNRPHSKAHSRGGMKLILEHQRRHLQAEIDWLDDVITRLTKEDI
ncbi:MAG: PadR family transcriptional regulator [Chloroflexi bacterium]|nr:MAG: PadR family transcriptional regulator [Chloroflexota bacterium]